ncbi:hypothetical protein ABT187_46170 [Streptomyces sp. NPDC001817]|uniref:hypothetical protein n=1 Tax=Streptomyces sp. NPDC001817 TaxID=3154398 RepID=UPI003333AED1
MNDQRWVKERHAVRHAAQRLTEDAGALMAASAEAVEAGLATRAEELRRAVVAAWSAGVAPEVLALDAGVKVAVIDNWVGRGGDTGLGS